MIINCESCSKKFTVKDEAIPESGRLVQCGYCSMSWHQMPTYSNKENKKEIKTIKNLDNPPDELSVDKIKASDGKTYRFLGSQWAELLPSGKTGLFAKKKIGKELDIKTGRKNKSVVSTKSKKIKKELNPSSEILNNNKKLPDIYKPNEGLGFFGYFFLFIIIALSTIGILKIFQNPIINYMPEAELIYIILEEQSEYILESVSNILSIIKDLINFY